MLGSMKTDDRCLAYDAVLVMSFGGPEGMDDVMPFLDNVLRGRNVPEERKLEVAHHYEQFGGISPLNAQNRAIIAAVEAELARRGHDLPVYFGNRNWHPMIGDTLRRMHADGVRHFLTFVTSSFSCYSGCRQYRENIQQAIDEAAPGDMTFHKIRVFFNHPAFVAMNAERIREAMASLGSGPADTTLAFTAHSIPRAMADNSKYEAQLREASSLVAEACGIEDWALVYQSRSGPPSMPWLEPDICDHINGLHERGVRHLVIAPIGFLSDHMEVLFDLDTEAREACETHGIPMARAKTVGDHPGFAAMVCDLIEERALNLPDRPTVGSMPPKHDVCPETCCLPPQRPR